MRPCSIPIDAARSWLIFLASALAGIGLFFIPAFVIRPFPTRRSARLTLAMALATARPPGELWLPHCICLVLAVDLWRGINLWRKIVLALMLLVAFAAVMARLNYFEWMFHPVDSAQFEAEAAASSTQTK